jgi:ABC-type sugar transport system substrate-binding protein
MAGGENMKIVPWARRYHRHPTIWLCAVAAVLALAACGKTSSAGSSSSAAAGSASSAGSSSSTTVASSSAGCGSVPTLPHHDQSGVLSSLGSRYTSQFNGYATPIFKSAYANFKPAGKPPYTVGISVTAPISPTQAALIPMLQKELRAVKGVGKVILLSSPPTGLTTQLQQAHSLIQQHVSFIVAEPLVPQPFIPIAAAAKAAGIPFISIFNATPSPNAINIAPNSVGDALTSGAQLAKMIGGKGVVLGVHGIEATGVDQESFAGWKMAFGKCPGIHFDSSIVGQFQPSVAKAQMLSYLSSHPQPVAGVVQTAGMTSGIIQAFQQTGRPLPVFVAAGPSVGEIAFFKSHTSRLVSAYTITPQGVVAATAYTISQLMAGHGPKISELSSLSDNINTSNLSKWAPVGASVNDQAVVEGPWLSQSYLAPLFGK